jgi:hypothetical protein
MAMSPGLELHERAGGNERNRRAATEANEEKDNEILFGHDVGSR